MLERERNNTEIINNRIPYSIVIMSSWKLVEAIPEAVPAEMKPSNRVNNHHSGSNQFGPRGQGGRGRCTF